MRFGRDEVDQSLAALGRKVAAELAPSGWMRRELDSFGVVVLTREIGNGVLATAEIGRASFGSPEGFPIAIGVRLGVGYEPALDLMPLLTLPPEATLVNNPETPVEPGFLVALDDPDDVEPASAQIVGFIDEHATEFARQFPDAEAIEAAMASGGATTGGADEGGHNEDPLHVTMVAVVGRHDEVRAWLAEQDARSVDLADRRLVRQLTRWLDAGGRAAPPLEETLARLPRSLNQPRPSLAATRAKARERKEALNAVRAQSKGKDLDQLKALLAAEYARREVDVAPTALARSAEMLQLERQAFGRVRSAWKAVRMLAAGGGDVVRLVKNSSESDPEWMRLPGRASYPVPTGRDSYTALELERQTAGWLEQVYAEAPRRLGAYVYVSVWLTRDGESIAAYIGDRHVGKVPDDDASAFDQAMDAAALFDEDPFVRGRLMRTETHTSLLEIPLPYAPAIQD